MPTILLLAGPPGVTKTKTARVLRHLLGETWKAVNKDDIAERFTNQREGKEYERHRREINDEVNLRISSLLAQGKNVLLDNPQLEITRKGWLDAFSHACNLHGTKVKVVLLETTEQGLRNNIFKRGQENPSKRTKDEWKLSNWKKFLKKYVKPFKEKWLREHPLVHVVNVPELKPEEKREKWIPFHDWQPVLKHVRE